MAGGVTSVVSSTGSELQVSSWGGFVGRGCEAPVPHMPPTTLPPGQPKTLLIKINAFGGGVTWVL